MKRDFSVVHDRRNTMSIKYDFAVEFGKPADVLPMWVADMDFRAPEEVLDDLRAVADHGIFGYSMPKDDYYAAVLGWFRDNFGWEAEKDWIIRTPGVVYAIANAVRAYTGKGDAVMITPPVYYPFKNVTLANDRRLVESPLELKDGRYVMDLRNIEAKIKSEKVKMFILCSPHNPVCRVWTMDELRELARICRENGVFVVSDEIHCDFTWESHPHTVFLKAAPEMADRAIVCTAPSKTFNLAGLCCSNIFIPDKTNREKFEAELNKNGGASINVFGLMAAKSAYEKGGEWLRECREYIRGNLDCLRDFLRENLPEIKLMEPEGTYFAWLDCSGLGLSAEELQDLILNKARLWLDDGAMFGESGAQFQRVVLACPRATLREALNRLRDAVRHS